MRIRWIQFLGIAALLAAFMLAMAPWLEKQTPARLADFWTGQILDADEAEAPALMRELAALGVPGLRALVGFIGSDRPALGAEAQRLIAAEVERCLSLEPAAASERLDSLVEALADQIDDFGPAGRQFAENLVERLLREDSRGQRLVSDAALRACERVLQAAAQDHRSRQARREPTAAEIDLVLSPYAAAALDRPTAVAPVVEESVPQEGNPLRAPGTLAEANSDEPVRVLSPEPEDEALNAPETLDLDPDPMRELPDLPLRRSAMNVKRAQLNQPLGEQAASRPPLVSEEARIIAWIRELRNPDPRVVHEAEHHLAETGFDARRLDLARQLVSHDPSVREQLAEELPRIPGIDAKTWLLWLARDDRAEVRRAAIGVMATIDDPDLAHQIQEITRRDPDSRVRQQGERLKEMRQGAESGLRR